jgi:hypothetical protein
MEYSIGAVTFAQMKQNSLRRLGLMNEIFSIMKVMSLLTETGVTTLELQVEVPEVYSHTKISQIFDISA